MTTPLRLGIAGLGTVGVGVVKIVRQKANLLAARTGRPVVITAVSARSRGKDRGVTLSGYAWEDDPVALATRDDVASRGRRGGAAALSTRGCRISH